MEPTSGVGRRSAVRWRRLTWAGGAGRSRAGITRLVRSEITRSDTSRDRTRPAGLRKTCRRLVGRRSSPTSRHRPRKRIRCQRPRPRRRARRRSRRHRTRIHRLVARPIHRTHPVRTSRSGHGPVSTDVRDVPCGSELTFTANPAPSDTGHNEPHHSTNSPPTTTTPTHHPPTPTNPSPPPAPSNPPAQALKTTSPSPPGRRSG